MFFFLPMPAMPLHQPEHELRKNNSESHQSPYTDETTAHPVVLLPPPETLASRLRDISSCLALPCMPWFLVWSAYVGVLGSFSTGKFPTFVKTEQIPYLFICYGVASVLSCWANGIIFDRFGWQYVVGIQVCALSARARRNDTVQICIFYFATRVHVFSFSS